MGSLRSAMKKVVGSGAKKVVQAWLFDAKSDVLSAPKITTYTSRNVEHILIGTKEGKLYQLEENGKVAWIFDAKADISEEEAMFLDQEAVNSLNTMPLVTRLTETDERYILVGSESGVLYCLNEQGKQIWQVKTDGPIRGAPVLRWKEKDSKPEVMVGSNDGFLYVISPKGEVIDKISVNEPIETSPLTVQEITIVGTHKGNIIALDNENEIAWKFETQDRITANIVAADLTGSGQTTLLVGSQDNYLYALSLDGEVEWSFHTQGAIISQVTIADINEDNRKEIIFGSCDNCIYCIDAKGELVWSYETDFWITATPIVKDVDGDGIVEVVAGSYDHKIYVLDSQGSYKLDYIPGLSGIIDQSGHYSNTINSEAGKNEGKVFCSFETQGNIVGCAIGEHSNVIITNTKQGKIYGMRVE